MSNKKNFVLDTNVILHDYNCIENFQENDIFIPIVVLEELDKFKKGNEQINFAARGFVRNLDKIADEKLFSQGVSLGKNKGKLFILPKNTYPKEIAEAFLTKTPDHLILGATLELSKSRPNEKTILVTKDVNLRMKARSLGVLTEDYINDKVADTNIFDKPNAEFSDIAADLIDEIYASPDGVEIEKFPLANQVAPNECFILKSERNSVLARFCAASNSVEKVGKNRVFGIEPRNAEQAFALATLLDKNIKLIALTGRAGTGKTLLALAAALAQQQDCQTAPSPFGALADGYKQILLARPIVALANKDLGALPGGAREKVAPYMQPLFDNLNVIKNNLQESEIRAVEQIQREGNLIIEALAFIRGRSLNHTFFIIDEAQNLTPHEIKTIITRAGQDTKIVFTGDIYQIDSPYLDLQSNGLVYMIDRMKGQKVFAHINLLKGERSELSELASNLL